MTKENDQLYAPDGYALISIEALKEWGKYEFVRDACQYPCQKMVPLSAYKELSALCTRQGIRLMELEDAQPAPKPEPVALPDYPERESLADLPYAQQVPDDWSPELTETWQKLQVAERNNTILHRHIRELRALYTAPPQREWVGMTHKERCELWNIASKFSPDAVIMHDYAREIEAALREKNA